MLSIKRITIRNFKNLKDVTFYPKKFNVIVGPNGSGKTSFIEFFKLLKKIYVEKNPYPFLEYGGYRNVVYNHRVELPLEFEIEITEKIRNIVTKVFYPYVFFSLRMKKENLEISSIYSSKIWSEAEKLRIINESIKISIPDLKMNISIDKSEKYLKIDINGECLEFREIRSSQSLIPEESLIYSLFLDLRSHKNYEEAKKLHDLLNRSFANIFEIEAKGEKISDEKMGDVLLFVFERFIKDILFTFFRIIKESIVLFPIDSSEIKKRKEIILKEEPLSYRGENVFDVLFLEQVRRGDLPSKVQYFLQTFFNSRGYFKEGNFYLYELEKELEVSKEHLPDGLIKSLVILTAMEKEPPLLFVDEVENSLHPELLEFLISTLKRESKGYVFVATHSPLVLNLVESEEIWIFKPTIEGVEVRNLQEYKNKEELQKELDELGLTLGEKVFYGLT